jgi:2'-5' RNA ligase
MSVKYSGNKGRPMPKMRYDHFEKNPQQRGTSDFNFNINFGDMPQVAEMAATLGKMLKERERAAGLQLFHNPIPPRWLHLTEWYGSTKDFTEEEVLQAVGILRPMLASMQKPEAQLSTWWQADVGRAVPMLDVTPKEPFQLINALVRSAMQEVVGIHRVPEPNEPYDPHITTVYPKTYERTETAEGVVNSIHVEPVAFTVNSLVLVRQHWNDQNHPNHYEWEVIKEIPIGV